MNRATVVTLVALLFLGLASSQKLCVPNQFSTNIFLSERNDNGDNFLTFYGTEYFDQLSNKVRIDLTALNASDAPYQSVQIISRYDLNLTYFVYSEDECYQALLNGVIDDTCIPPNPDEVISIRIGSSVHASSYTFFTNETWRIVLEDKTLYPIYELVTSYSDQTIFSLIEFHDFTPGPQAASLFNPPSFCNWLDESSPRVLKNKLVQTNSLLVPEIPAFH